MCVSFELILSILNSLPYIFLFTMPLYGAVLGTDVVLRFSVSMYIFALLQSYLPKMTSYFSPILNYGFLILMFGINSAAIPQIIIFVYEQFIYITEIVLLVVEVFQLVTLTIKGSKKLVGLIDENPSLGKGLILGISSICYLLTIVMCCTAAAEDPILFSWYGGVLLVLQLVVHVTSYYKDCGVISEAALISLLSTFTLKSIQYEATLQAVSTSLRTLLLSEWQTREL